MLGQRTLLHTLKQMKKISKSAYCKTKKKNDSSIIFPFPLSADLKWKRIVLFWWCWQGVGFSLEPVNEREQRSLKFPRLTSACSYILRHMHLFMERVFLLCVVFFSASESPASSCFRLFGHGAQLKAPGSRERTSRLPLRERDLCLAGVKSSTSSGEKGGRAT